MSSTMKNRDPMKRMSAAQVDEIKRQHSQNIRKTFNVAYSLIGGGMCVVVKIQCYSNDLFYFQVGIVLYNRNKGK